MDIVPVSLKQMVTEELLQAAPAEVDVFIDAIRQRFGTTVVAILFYGSCLRKRALENEVADFYVLVDSYDAAYRSSPFLRSSNTLLPPNVFYMERSRGDVTLRAKYAVISYRDFAHAASSQCLHSIVWGRFCQPARLVYVRDEAAQHVVIEAVGQSIMTMVARIAPLLLASEETEPMALEELWQLGFRESYRMELRPELPGTIRALYETMPQRYHRVADAAFHDLARHGWLWVRTDAAHGYVTIPKLQLWYTRLSWHWRRPFAKGIYFLRLAKSAFTFGDWFPYVLWKIGRHRGENLEATDRQRKHPFIFGVPVLIKLLLRGDLR
ncbi:MAG: hypothetical protein FJ147_09550 [Deltaproteobacteria bacterium]|nr:hypothetical protein [Deltaproteobacteria bacterium]